MATNSVEYLFNSSLGLNNISTANSNLDGSGAIATIITGAAKGTLIKTLIVKAQTNTSQGIVRLFVKKSGGSNFLISEVLVPQINKSGRDLSFYKVIPLNYTLETGEELNISTQNADTFNLIAEAFDISYIANPTYVGSSIEYVSNCGTGLIDVANPNLDGSGTMTQIFMAGPTGSGYVGCVVNSIGIKALQTTTPGMVRLFLKDNVGGTAILFCEVVIPSVVQSATTPAFLIDAIRQGSLYTS